MGAVASEKDRGTAALIVAKPVGRAGFLVAKLAAIGLYVGWRHRNRGCGGMVLHVVLFGALPTGGIYRRRHPGLAAADGAGIDHVPRQHAVEIEPRGGRDGDRRHSSSAS